MFCRHRKITTPRRDADGEYCCCLECGARIAWALDGPPLPPPVLTQPSARQVARVWKCLFEGDSHRSVVERISK